jgi:hypothetical protein
MMYRPGDHVTATGPIAGVLHQGSFDPLAKGWKQSNVRALISQGLLVVSTSEATAESGSELFRVAGAGGKHFVVRGVKVTDLMLKDDADKFIAEANNGDESPSG